MAYSRFSFFQALVSNLLVPKLAFDDPEYVLHFAADSGVAPSYITDPVNCVVICFGKYVSTEVDAVVSGG